MKRIIALLLALVTVFSLAACGKSDDNDGEGKEVEDSEYADPAKLLSAVLPQIREASSLKVDVSGYLKIEHPAIPEESTDSPLNEGEYKTVRLLGFEGSVIIAKSEDSVNAIIDITLKHVITENGETAYDEETPYLIYLIDGTFYRYDEYKELWFSGDLLDSAEVSNAVTAILDSLALDSGEATETATRLCEKIVKAMCIEEGVGGSYTLDARDEFNKIVEMINGLSRETGISDTVNYFLAFIHKDLTLRGIVDELEKYAGKTAVAAVEEFNKWLSANYGVTADELIREVMSSKTLVAIIAPILGLTDSEVEKLKNINLAEFVASSPFADDVLYNVISELLFPEDGPTKAQLFAELRRICNSNIGEVADRYMGEGAIDEIIEDIKERFGSVVFDKLDTTLTLDLTEKNEIDFIDLSASLDMNYTVAESSTDDFDYMVKISGGATVKIHSITKETYTVKLPDGSKIIPDLVGKTFLYRMGDNGYEFIGAVGVDYRAAIDVELDVNSDVSYYVYYYDLPFSALSGNTITLYASYGSNQNIKDDMTITYDPEGGFWVLDETK